MKSIAVTAAAILLLGFSSALSAPSAPPGPPADWDASEASPRADGRLLIEAAGGLRSFAAFARRAAASDPALARRLAERALAAHPAAPEAQALAFDLAHRRVSDPSTERAEVRAALDVLTRAARSRVLAQGAPKQVVPKSFLR